MSDILTVSDVTALAYITEAASRSAVVRWLDLGDELTVREGTARHIVRGPDPSEWYFIGRETDVRDAYLRVTMTNGFDVALPVRALMSRCREGGFVIDEVTA